MSPIYSDEDGKFLVGIARHTVDQYVTKESKPNPPDATPEHLWKKSGVFVTLNTVRGETVSLRGCIGRPYPTQPLIEATIDSATDSAVHDPRFSRVIENELDSILVEMNVLTPPLKLEYSDPSELLSLVEVGRNGLIAVQGMRRGLLLPQVPVDWGWDTKQFLEHTCNKAGLVPSAWMDKKTEFLAFQAEIFGEEKPRGNVIRNPSHSRC